MIELIKRDVQAMVVILVVLALGLVYVSYQYSSVRAQVDELRRDFNSVIVPLATRVSELEDLLVTAEVTIVYGADNFRTETVNLTKGATALEALQRVAVVETKYYPAIPGYYIVSIDGLSENLKARLYWAFYYRRKDMADWVYSEVGAGAYRLEEGDSIKFSYETW